MIEVRVKALVWQNDMLFCGQPHAYADTPLGPWAVTAYDGRGGRWAYDDPSGDMSDMDWPTREEAQAAAQADYETRILAALEPQDAPAMAEELVALRAERIARLEAALEWYGEQARLARLIHSEGDEGRHNLDADGGKRARAALAEGGRDNG